MTTDRMRHLAALDVAVRNTEIDVNRALDQCSKERAHYWAQMKKEPTTADKKWQRLKRRLAKAESALQEAQERRDRWAAAIQLMSCKPYTGPVLTFADFPAPSAAHVADMAVALTHG